MAISFLKRDDLAPAAFSRELEGDEVGVPASIILVDAGPGEGPGLHVHSYAELFFVLEGSATFTDGEQERTATAGELVIVPPDQPHGFVNSGPGRLRQIDVHLSGRFGTRWLDREQTA
jgi:mannose-6-phosphate isomerase-like protein (cupin superfamily)